MNTTCIIVTAACDVTAVEPISDGEQRLFNISSVSTSGVGDWEAEIETVIGVATLR